MKSWNSNPTTFSCETGTIWARFVGLGPHQAQRGPQNRALARNILSCAVGRILGVMFFDRRRPRRCTAVGAVGPLDTYRTSRALARGSNGPGPGCPAGALH